MIKLEKLNAYVFSLSREIIVVDDKGGGQLGTAGGWKDYISHFETHPSLAGCVAQHIEAFYFLQGRGFHCSVAKCCI
jgi:hypothetical protein